MRNTFHHAAVAEENVGEMINDIKIVAVKRGCQRTLRYRHADGIADALSEGSGRGLDPRRIAVLRVPGRFRVQLAKILEVFDGDVVAAQVKQRICQHRSMPV